MNFEPDDEKTIGLPPGAVKPLRPGGEGVRPTSPPAQGPRPAKAAEPVAPAPPPSPTSGGAKEPSWEPAWVADERGAAEGATIGHPKADLWGRSPKPLEPKPKTPSGKPAPWSYQSSPILRPGPGPCESAITPSPFPEAESAPGEWTQALPPGELKAKTGASPPPASTQPPMTTPDWNIGQPDETIGTPPAVSPKPAPRPRSVTRPAPRPATEAEEEPSWIPRPPQQPRETPPPESRPTPDRTSQEEGTQTIVGGLGLPEEEIPNVKFVSIKAFAGQAGWLLIDQAQLDERGFVFGNKRLEDKSQKPRRYLAREHFRLTWQDNQLVVEPLESLNGVYLKLRPGRKAPLHDGTWFVIGRHVVVFRTSQEEPTQSSPRIGPGNEVFLSRPLVVLAYLDFLGPDARPSITVPITKMDYTDLGRTGGNRCDIALPDDDWISSQHARIHHVNGTFLLEDLHSRNGTYIRMQEHTQLKLGSIQNEAAGDVILVGDLFLRFVEQQ